MKHLMPILTIALLGSAALPAITAADDRRDPVQHFYKQIVGGQDNYLTVQDRKERLAGRYYRDDDDDDGRRRGGRDDNDDDDD